MRAGVLGRPCALPCQSLVPRIARPAMWQDPLIPATLVFVKVIVLGGSWRSVPVSHSWEVCVLGMWLRLLPVGRSWYYSFGDESAHYFLSALLVAFGLELSYFWGGAGDSAHLRTSLFCLRVSDYVVSLYYLITDENCLGGAGDSVHPETTFFCSRVSDRLHFGTLFDCWLLFHRLV